MKFGERWIVGLITIIGLVLLLVVLSDVSSGETIIVAKDGNGDYEKIQYAIDNATAGDTIMVWEGTYYENVVVNKTVSLVGNGSEVTTIDGGGGGDVVNIAEDWVNVSGFRVTGSGSSGYYAGINVISNHSRLIDNNCSGNGYGIHLQDSSNCTIENNTCSNNSYPGIMFQYSNNCTLTNNICLSNNNGICFFYSQNNIIDNNTCSYNAFGINLEFSNKNAITNNTCSNNEEHGIYLQSGGNHCNYNTIENNTCSNNGNDTMWEGYGIVGGFYSIIINNTCSNNYYGIAGGPYSTIIGNTCTNNIFGIKESSRELLIIENNCSKNENGIYIITQNCTINGNTCSDNSKYGIFLSGNWHIITNNTCRQNKIGIMIWASSHNTLSNNTISENVCGINISGESEGYFGKIERICEDNVVYYNWIFSNSEYGINSVGTEVEKIDARFNYWGNESGPYHPKNNPQGRCDNAADNVQFSPWLDDEGNMHYSEDDDNGGGFLPGFEATAVIGVIGVTVILCRRKRKKEL